eukprot:CAMPEP_0197036988 /NCGR_PEP_ID=MMETSP1384-20130603/14309_1 /TAXON_ID=29189 /ORGANISM="Ammonia sp." /LENGTH=660 /DNA_ID=CAMNT_0042467227 /DNA_START=50 /DNA_END=2032 /DNA_ORIENTATION=+
MTESKEEGTTANAEETSKTPMEPKSISLNLYNIVYKARLNHGCSTEDYDVYRKYLSKQISTLRKKLKLQCIDTENTVLNQKKNQIRNRLQREKLKKIKQGKLKPERDPKWNPKYKKPRAPKKKTWQYREIGVDDLYANPECLLIALYLSERAWSYSKSIYEQYDEDHKRKYHHSNSRLRKAISNAEKLCKLLTACGAAGLRVDNETKLQSFGYVSWLKANYYLQCAPVTQSFPEYLKFMKTTPNNYQLLEGANETNLSTKLAYFHESIDKPQRAQMEQSADEFVLKLKQQLSISSDGENDEEEKQSGNASAGKAASNVFVEYGNNKVSVPDIDGLPVTVNSLYDELNGLESKDIANAALIKKLSVFTRIVIIIDRALAVIQKELKKFNHSAVQDAAANTFYVIEKYLSFQKLRFSVSRQYLWMINVLHRRNGSKASSKRHSHLLYEFAVLCETQIKNLDELSTITDLTDYQAFTRQIEILRDQFEISRKFYIAKIYHVALKQYANAYQLLQHQVVQSASEFVQKFDYKKEDKSAVKDTMYDFSQLIDIEHSKKMMQDIAKEAHTLSMLSKANYVLQRMDTAQDDVNVMQDIDDADMQKIVIDLDRKLYPLLAKPMMIDVAWNFIDYHDILTKSEAVKKEAPKPAEPKKQKSGWFGGLWGQ